MKPSALCLVFALCFVCVYTQEDERICKRSTTYDYIVVGAGSAGAALAKELSDNFDINVLLIEAGPNRDDEPNVKNPDLANTVASESYYNFDYYSSALPSHGNRRIACPVGRMWGGCSSHNHMQYVIGNDYDYDRWALYGGPEWSAASVRAVFKRMENNSLSHVANLTQFLQYHGTAGRVSVRNDIPAQRDFYEKFREVVHDVLYLHENPDINGKTQEGLISVRQYTQQTLSNNEFLRESSSTAFLSDDIVAVHNGDGYGVYGRKLWVHSNSFATKLIFDDNRKVTGIIYTKNGVEVRAMARKDIIISMGALNTPAFLMRNGIGNCTELAELGIACVVDNPSVGKHLQDHPVIPVFGQISGPISDFLLAVYRSGCVHQYTNTSLTGGKLVADTFMQFIPAVIYEYPFTYTWNQSKSSFTMLATQLRPHSTGRIRIPSKDPLAPPVIDHGYLSHDNDLDWALHALEDIEAVLHRLWEIDPSTEVMYPTPAMLTKNLRSDTVRHIVDTLYHHSGTARMGEVVDGNLCVKGIKGLRVADASIMPHVTSSNTNAACMMIGMKAADLIRKNPQCN